MRARRGAVLGIVVVVAYVALCVLAATTAENKAAASGPAAARSFLKAWARSRTGTYVLTATYERRARNGTTLRSAVRVVQRPPDRLVFQFGAVAGRLGDRLVVCPKSARQPCRTGLPGRTYAADTHRQLAVIDQYVGGSSPRYAVVHDGRCFTLRLARGFPAAYGDEAVFCFDDETGAPVRIRVTNKDIVEEETATEVRPAVSPADLRLRGSTA